MPKYLNHLLTKGVPVEITDPKHPKSAHPATFLGQVCYCHEDHVLVKDTQDHTYDVYLDEILSLMSYESSTTAYCLRIGEHGYDVVCILPTGIVETLATTLDKITAVHLINLLSKPVDHQPLAA